MTDPWNQLVSEIEPGDFTLVFDYQPHSDEPARFFQIRFSWDGETAASFVYDVWEGPDTSDYESDVDSAPVSGWASWVSGEDALIAFTQPMADDEGWARVDSGAPGAAIHDLDGGLSEPETWISFARLIHAVVTDAPVQGMTRQTY